MLTGLAAPASVRAQGRPGIVRPAVRPAAPRPPRFVIDVSGGVQSAGSAVADRLEFETNAETAAIDVRYPAASGVVVTGGVGVALWKQLGAGVSVSTATRSGAATIEGRIPHPFFFERPRPINGKPSGIDTTETALHAQLLVAVPAGRRLTLTLSGGPTFARLARTVITEVRYSETYPFDAVSFTGVTTRRDTLSSIGFNAGADARWMFTRRVGAGMLVRYYRASMDGEGGGGRPVTLEAGGAQAAAGLRLVF